MHQMMRLHKSDGFVSLVNFLGDERIKFQVVHEAIEGKVSFKKDETKFTMVTEAKNLPASDFLGRGRRKIGLVLWIDSADYEKWHSLKS